MRLLFAGSPEIAVPALRLLAGHHDIAAVLTNPDRPSGRGRRLEASPVKTEAGRLGLEVLQPEKLDAAVRARVCELKPELLAVVAFGRIFGPRFLGLFPLGGLNMHPSLLPRWRGPAPITAAILAGDRETGISIQRLAPRVDSGDILLQERFGLDGSETAGALGAVCAERGAALFARALESLERGSAVFAPQNEAEASYCGLVSKDDGRIDWSQPAERIERMLRAYSPWPACFTTLDGETLVLHKASVQTQERPAGAPGQVLGVDKRLGILVQTGNGVLAVRELQLQSKKRLDFRTFLNGRRDLPGRLLGG